MSEDRYVSFIIPRDYSDGWLLEIGSGIRAAERRDFLKCLADVIQIGSLSDD